MDGGPDSGERDVETSRQVTRGKEESIPLVSLIQTGGESLDSISSFLTIFHIDRSHPGTESENSFKTLASGCRPLLDFIFLKSVILCKNS